MPIIIEIDPESSKRAGAMIPNAELRLIRLEKASLLTPAHSPGAGQLETEVSFKPSETALAGNDLMLAVDFEFRVVLPTEASEQQNLLSISCTFAAEYDLRPGFSPDREQIEAFHKGNVVLNCWPYFREFVQSSAVRMDYPPPPVPLLRLHFTRPVEQVSAAAKHAPGPTPKPRAHPGRKRPT